MPLLPTVSYTQYFRTADSQSLNCGEKRGKVDHNHLKYGPIRSGLAKYNTPMRSALSDRRKSGECFCLCPSPELTAYSDKPHRPESYQR